MASNRLTRKPKIDTLTLTGLDDLEADALQSFETIEFGRFDGIELTDRERSGITLTDCELTTVSVENVEWGGSRIFDTVLTSVNAPRLAWPRTSVRNVRINGSRVGAFDLFEDGPVAGDRRLQARPGEPARQRRARHGLS